MATSDGVYQYSFVLSGMAGVGKTSIFNYIKRQAEKNGDLVEWSTNDGGLDCCVFSSTVRGIKCKISLFDTGGLERYASLTSNYYHRCHAVILVYLNNPDRLDTLTCLNLSIESALSYNKSPDLLVFTLWGNNMKSGSSLEESSSSLVEHIHAFQENSSIPSDLQFIINPHTGKGIDDALDKLVYEVYLKCRPKVDSVLTPNILDDNDEFSKEISTLEREERCRTPLSQPTKQRKCCK